MTSNTTKSRGQLFRIMQLPHPNWAKHWSNILIDLLWQKRISNYADLFATGNISEYVGASKMIIFHGPSGTGKTSLAKGLANYVAQKQIGGTTCFWVNAESWRDHRLGESSKAVSQAFETIYMAARNGNVILIIDELEAVAISRQRTLNANEPSDVITSVDILLNQIDLIQQAYSVLIICTSNLVGAIDSALLNRADLCVPFDLPNLENRIQILNHHLSLLGEHPHQLTSDELAMLGKQTEGLSGRELAKLPLQARLEAADISRQVQLKDYLRVIQSLSKSASTIQPDRGVSNGHLH